MKKHVLYLVILFVAFATSSCGDDDGDAGPNLLPEQTLAESDHTLTRYSVDGDVKTFVNDHEVPNNIISFRENKTLHTAMFTRFVGIVPSSRRNFVKRFTPFHGGNEIAGYVYPLNDSRTEWNFGLDVLTFEEEERNIANASPGDNVFVPASATILHEYGHLLSLFADQLNLNNSNCTNFESAFGCMADDSMLQDFFQQFWTDTYDEYLEVQQQFSDPEAEWFSRYPDSFVSSYAATQPEEDFAESFMAFFFRDQPTGNTIEDQKIGYFFDFPELVTLKNGVLDYLRNEVLSGTPPPPGTGGRILSFELEAGLESTNRVCGLNHFSNN